jgi:hypothetical protein
LEDIFIIIGITDTPTLAACAATCRLFREILYKVSRLRNSFERATTLAVT